MSIESAKSLLQNYAIELNDLKELDINEMFRYLISCGDLLPTLDESEMIDENFVKGCVSNAYVVVEHGAEEGSSEEKVLVRGYAEAMLVKGFIAILSLCCKELTPQELHSYGKELFSEFLAKVDLQIMLTPTRANSFGLVIELIFKKSIKLLQ